MKLNLTFVRILQMSYLLLLDCLLALLPQPVVDLCILPAAVVLPGHGDDDQDSNRHDFHEDEDLWSWVLWWRPEDGTLVAPLPVFLDTCSAPVQCRPFALQSNICPENSLLLTSPYLSPFCWPCQQSKISRSSFVPPAPCLFVTVLGHDHSADRVFRNFEAERRRMRVYPQEG